MNKLAAANLSTIYSLRRQGSKIILTYCDNHLFSVKIPAISEFYKELFKISDHIIYPTETLKALSQPYIPKNAETWIIKDPWQVRAESPYQRKEKELKERNKREYERKQG